MNEKHATRDYYDEVFRLHDKQKHATLSAKERERYEIAKAEVARSLLAAQELLRAPQQRRRESLRLRYCVPVTLTVRGRRHASMTVNVSSQGCAVVLEAAPDAEVVEVDVRFPCGLGVRGRAQVVAVVHHGGAATACLRYLDQNDIDRALVDDAIVGLAIEQRLALPRDESGVSKDICSPHSWPLASPGST